jgi:hypothetical protein
MGCEQDGLGHASQPVLLRFQCSGDRQAAGGDRRKHRVAAVPTPTGAETAAGPRANGKSRPWSEATTYPVRASWRKNPARVPV